ncbi:4a-hydroxytetrahydrobiopterin dehydratase [Rhabdochlamydiaceae symbiont of Dictyostelium giganteum]|uniref:4a-hydroxytetrahydrobiopterin dehydratase n=1 Tax=Rhabdochlamydiaceae symbiont of Dictyostelium giganteum TaxID=3342349 RepID=UPI00384C1170
MPNPPKRCLPCEGFVSALPKDEQMTLLKELSPGWDIVNAHHLSKTFIFKDFKAALEFTQQVGKLAEEEQHHPLIHLSWGKVVIDIWTHRVDGLTENDFILATYCDALLPLK